MSQITMTTEMTLDDCVALGYDKSDLCDEATWAAIVEWFGLRRVQPNFDRYFSRALKLHYPHFLELVRIEPGVAEYDWFVENYKEQQTKFAGQSERNIVGEKSVTKSGTNGGSVTVTGTDGNTRTLNTTDTDSTSGTDGHTGSNNSTSSDVERTTDAMRSAPMSASISGTRSGSAGTASKSMAWNDITNPTQTEDNLHDSAHTENGGDSYSDTHSSSSEGHQTGTITDAGSRSQQTTNNLTHSETSSNSEEGTISGTNNNETRTILKGRDKGIAELLVAARDAIIDTESFEWLKEKLDTCFMQAF